MESIVLRFVSNGEYLNFLETDNLDVGLEEIRKRLKEECSDILPGPFRFIFKDVAMSKKQEARLSVRQICSEQVMPNQISILKTSKTKSVFDVSLRFDSIQDPDQTNHNLNDSSSTPVISTPPTLADISKSPMPIPHRNESLSETRSVGIDCNLIEPKTKCSHLRLNKTDLYSDTDIQSQQSWLEKERMQFWNSKAQALEISKETLSFKKTDLIGAVDVSWAYRKVELLNIKISELEIRQERYRNVFYETYVRIGDQSKTSNLNLNFSPKAYQYKDEISKYLYFIEKEHKKIKDLQKVQAKEVLTDVIDAENRIHDYLHQLKCNSDYLFKALSVWEKRLDNFRSKNITPAENLDDGTYEIDTTEMIDLAADVLNINAD